MIWAFLLLNVCAVTAAAYWRYAGGGLAHASPIAMSGTCWLWGMGILAGLGVSSAVAERKRLSVPRARGAALELLLLPLAFGYSWACLPPKVKDYSAVNWAVIAVLCAALIWLLWRDRRSAADFGLTARNFGAAARRLILPTAIMAALPVAVAVETGTDFEAWRAVRGAVTYPLYALVQLLLFQVFLVQRLRHLSDSSAAVIVVAAGMFALLHWPNAVAMAACGAAAVVWTWVYLTRPNVYALAISMGIAATTFTQVLPHKVTHHMRVGPMYVYREMRRVRATAAAKRAAAASAPVEKSGVSVGERDRTIAK